MNMKPETRHKLSATATTLLGTFIVFAVVITMNELSKPPKDGVEERQTRFEVEREEPEQPQIVEQKQPEPPQEPTAPPPPLAELDSSIGSVDIPIPGFDLSQLDNLARDAAGSNKDLVMTDESVDEPPRATSQAPLEYPTRAKVDYVLVSLLIGENGEVQKVRVLESQPGGVFEKEALESVRNWQFEPARYQGQRVRVWARQKIRFDLG
jgi:protein TonB